MRNANISGFRYALALDIGEQTLSMLDKEVDLQKTNVIFLCWSSPPDAVGQVLSRSPAAAKFVTGTTVIPNKPAPARRTRRR